MKIKQTLLVAAILLGSGLVFVPTALASTCGGVTTSILSCDKQTGNGVCPDGQIITKADIDSGTKCHDGSNPKVDVTNTGVWGILMLVINILTAGVGIAAVGGLIYGAILYASASDNAEQIKTAKDIMKNVAIGLVMYLLMYAFLNFIVPGGMFN